MITSDKLKVYEDDTMLSMEYKWFSPGAIFMIFFSVIWFTFLAFWYGMAAGTGAPWIFFVFPLIHVSVGLWILYYSLCLLFNKTKIIINNELMNVIHYPIPWFKGNKKFETQEFQQLYVKQKVSKGKNNSEKFTYAIRAKLKDGKDIEVASIGGLESQDAQRIEEYLEQYLGIDNMPVKGEFGHNPKLKGSAHPRRLRKTSLSPEMSSIYRLETNEEIYFKGKNHQAAHLTQYDWANGDSDKLIQLIDTKGKDTLVFLQKNQAILKVYVESLLDLHESTGLGFTPNKPSNTLQFKGQEYLLTKKASGQAFLTGISKPVSLHQWLYQTKDKSAHLRIVVNDDMLTYYQGKKTALTDFSNSSEESLDLPQLDKDPLTDWEDQELV